jgi:surface carbohydrate biosynthesis protein
MRHLYLPVTSQPRELDSKLLLALFARGSGMRPIVGYKSSLLAGLPRLLPGVFLLHNARQSAEKTSLLKAFGHRVVVLDEEALIRQSDEIFLKKHPQNAFKTVDMLLCWGQNDHDMWQRHKVSVPEGFGIVGNPRMDLLRHELAPVQREQIDALRHRYGRFVLLNTNFPSVNNLTPQGGGVRLASWAMDERGRRINHDFIANKTALFEAELDLVAPLARAIHPTTLVIRPHPNENHEPWHKSVQGISNAEVAFEGGVIPWLMAAEALIHNNCTTAVEAVVAGTPVLNFVPWLSEFDNALAHAFGQSCADAMSLAASLSDILSGRHVRLTVEQQALLEHHIANVSGPFSCERIVGLVDAAYPREFPVGLRKRLSIEAKIGRLWLKRYVNSLASRRGRAMRRYLAAKQPELRMHHLDHEQLGYSLEQLELLMRQFPPLDLEALNRRIAGYADALGRFGSLKVRRLSHFTFTLD